MTSSFVNELFLTCISSLEYGASDEHGYGHQSPLQDRASDEHGYGASDEHGYVHQLRLQYGASDEHGYGRHSYSTEQAMSMVMDIHDRYSTE